MPIPFKTVSSFHLSSTPPLTSLRLWPYLFVIANGKFRAHLFSLFASLSSSPSRNSASPLLCNGAFVLSSYPSRVTGARACLSPLFYFTNPLLLQLPFHVPSRREYTANLCYLRFSPSRSPLLSLRHSLLPDFLFRCRSVYWRASGFVLISSLLAPLWLIYIYLIYTGGRWLFQRRAGPIHFHWLELIEKYSVCSFFPSAAYRHRCRSMLSFLSFLSAPSVRSQACSFQSE